MSPGADQFTSILWLVPVDIRSGLTRAEAMAVAADVWGLSASARPLDGYAVENFLLETTGGERFVLKASVDAEAEADLDFQNRLLEHLAGSESPLAIPRLVSGRDGREVVEHAGADGGRRRLRLLTWLPGTPWIEAGATPGLRRQLGAALGQIDRILTGFEHASAERDLEWDLRHASRQRRHIAAIPDPGRRRLADLFLHRFAAASTLYGDRLERSVIHGDAHERNLLVTNGRLSGLLDFGDSVATWTICDPAIAIAYAMLPEPDPLAAAAEIVSAYHRERPLGPDELAVLYPFACGRLAQSVVAAARRRRAGATDEYLFVTEAPAWATLEKLAAIDPETARRRLAAACGAGAGGKTPPGDRDQLLAARRHRLGPSLSLAYERPLHITRGYRQFLYGADGRPYLDLVNNVCHVGHCHPTVVAAAARQMATLNTNTRYLYDGLTAYAERLCATLPAALEVCFFVNSGSEANELAIRLARAATGRRDLLVLDGAYHGHTNLLVEASPYKFLGPGGSGRAADWIHVAPMPDPYRGAHRGAGPETGALYAAALDKVVAASPRPIAALLCEPILGCGGQVVPPTGFLAGAYDTVRRAGGLTIADEVQVGFGRPGSHFWAFETQGVEPDIVAMGKPIGNGHPMAAVVTTREIADAFANGMEFFATFGGNPVSCAVGMAVLDVIAAEGLQRRAAELGRRMLAGLTELAGRHPLVGDVRGIGLFAGVELVRDRETLEPATSEAGRIVDRLAKHGILLSTDGPSSNVLKIKPPMVLTTDDVDFFVRELDRELEHLARHGGKTG